MVLVAVALAVVWFLDHRRLIHRLGTDPGSTDGLRHHMVTTDAHRSTLAGLGPAIAQGRLAEFIVGAIADVLPSEAVCLFRFAGAHARLVAAAGPGAIHETSRTFNVPLASDPLLGEIVDTVEPVHISTYAESDELRFQYLGQRFTGGAGVPVMGDSGPVGALVIHLGSEGPGLPDDWSETLSAFAGLVRLVEDGPSATTGFLSGPLEEGLAPMPIGVALHDESMTFTYANPVAVALDGAVRSELVGRPAAEVLFPATYDMHEYLIRTRATDPVEYTAMWATRRPVPDVRYLHVWSLPIHTSRGMLIALVSSDVTDDVTAKRERIRRLDEERNACAKADAAKRDALVRVDELRATTSSLRRENERLVSALDLQSDWVIAVDDAGRVVATNGAVREWMVMSEGEMHGRHLAELVVKETAAAFLDVARTVRNGGEPIVFAQHVVRVGRATNIVWTVGPWSLDGRAAGVVGVGREDLSGDDGGLALELAVAHRRVAQIQMSRGRDDPETRDRRRQEVDASKDEVLALISHDLRTPLTSILGYTDLLLGERSGLDSRHERFVKVIARNGERLMGLVDDLLLVAQHQSGALTVSPAPTHAASVVTQSVTAAHPEATAMEIAISTDIPADLVVMADAGRLGQVLDNLIANAVKYTQRGGYVVVSAGRDGDRVRFRVSDNGPGIPSDELDRIFERFTRARDATTGGAKGFGLGLPIAHAIVEAHGGEIGVESAPGIGSTFWFTLPVADASADIDE